MCQIPGPKDDDLMIVVIGSQNKIKINAVHASLSRLYPDVKIRGVEVDSGVSAQPWGDDEIIKGAINRAKAALGKIPGADLGVGMEAGIVQNEFGCFTNAWCAICDPKGQVSLGGGFNVELPPQVVQDLEAGLDLGQAMSKVPVLTPHKHSDIGAIGVLTKNFLNRQIAYESIVLCAMARYTRTDLYPKESKGEVL